MNEDQKQVFGSLYTEYNPMVVQVCLGFFRGDHDLANDLAQEVFINVWNSLSKFRGESSPKTWIYRITVNTCLLHLRKEKGRERSKLAVEEIHQESTPQLNIDSLYNAIGQLEEVERLIMMMMLDELDHDTIARVMGIKINNLRVKIFRIKNKLKYLMNYERRND